MKHFIKPALIILCSIYLTACGGGGDPDPDGTSPGAGQQLQSKTYGVTLQSVELIDASGNAVSVAGVPLIGETVEIRE